MTALVRTNPNRLRTALPMPQALDPDVRAWYDEQTTKDPVYYVKAVDNFVRGAKYDGWWDAHDGEIWLGFGRSFQGFSGLKLRRRSSDMSIVNGGITFIRDHGVKGDPGLVGYIDTGWKAVDYPGVTLNGHSMWIYTTSNLLGGFQEMGAAGSGGLKSLMIRASSGFRGGIWSAAAQIISGGGKAAGFHGFSRTSDVDVFSLRDGVLQTSQLFAESLPSGHITICSAEPGKSNSPNRIGACGIGATLTQEQLQQVENRVEQLSRALSLYDEIQIPDEISGPSCFGRFSIEDVVPSDRRVYRQISFPSTDRVDSSTYAFFPISDAVSRTHLHKTAIVAVVSAGLTFTNGSNEIIVNDPNHLAQVGDVVKVLINYNAITNPINAVRGITRAEIEVWHYITDIVDDNNYKFEVVSNATSSGTGGGAFMTRELTRCFIFNSTFIVPRDGVHWSFQWSPEGERDTVDGPINGRTKPNDCYPPFNRQTGTFTGVQCRPSFTTKQRAVGALLVQTAWMCGYLDRNDPDDQFGWGYLDYAEQYDLDPTKVHLWNWFAVNRETVFTESVAGFAACYDYVWLTQFKLRDNTSFPRFGVMMDMEHADNRNATDWETDLKRWTAMCECKDVRAGWLGHHMSGQTAVIQGFTPGPGGNAPRLVQDPNLTCFNIISSNQSTPPDIIDSLNAQVAFCTDADGYFPYDKALLSCTLGVGQGLITQENAQRVADWGIANNIKHVHVRRAVSNEGGSIDLYRNQLMLKYFPNIEGVGDLDPDGIVVSWISSLADVGEDVSADRQALLTALFTTLTDSGTWDKIDYWIMAGETQAQSLKDFVTHRDAVMHGSPLPTFTVDRGFTFDGTQNYLMANFFPSTVGNSMLGDSMSAAVYERTNVASNGIAFGGNNDTTLKGLALCPRDASDHIKGQANSSFTALAGVTSSLGLSWINRTGASPSVFSFGKNGSPLSNFTPATQNAVLPTQEMAIGACNSNGTIDQFRASEIFCAIAGAEMTSDDWDTVYTALQAYATAIGADV